MPAKTKSKSAVNLAQEDVEEIVVQPKIEPPIGTVEWIYWWSDKEGNLPVPINVSITGSIPYHCPELQWFNFEVYPHKVKLTNTGHTVHLAPKWKAERPYLLGGPLLEKHVIGQIHFHWGPDMLRGSAHTVDKVNHPAEMQVTFFKSEYMTQEEALKHEDGVVMFCFLIKYGVNPDPRLDWVTEGFPRVLEAGTCTKVGPKPMCQLMPMFFEDYFLYWGNLATAKGDNFTIRWLVSRKPLWATMEQIKEFRTLWDPWDIPNKGNWKPLEEIHNRHIFLISPHWNLYNSLLPIPRIDDPSISKLSEEYRRKTWMLPAQNASLLELLKAEEEAASNKQKEDLSVKLCSK